MQRTLESRPIVLQGLNKLNKIKKLIVKYKIINLGIKALSFFAHPKKLVNLLNLILFLMKHIVEDI